MSVLGFQFVSIHVTMLTMIIVLELSLALCILMPFVILRLSPLRVSFTSNCYRVNSPLPTLWVMSLSNEHLVTSPLPTSQPSLKKSVRRGKDDCFYRSDNSVISYWSTVPELFFSTFTSVKFVEGFSASTRV